MTTLLLSENFPPQVGGSGRWFWEIYRRQPADSFLVAAAEHPRQAEFDGGSALPIHRLPLSFPSWLPDAASWAVHREAYARLRSLAAGRRVTMLHCGRCLPEGLLALRLRLRTGTPYVCFAHGEEVNLSGPSWWRGRAYHSRKVALAAGVVLRQARGVIANSHNTRSILTDRWGLPAERVHVLHPGVDTARFLPAAADSPRRRELGWGDRTVLLTVGRLQRRKGHDVLIAALPLIRRRFPDVLYAIVGDGEERAALGGLARRLGVEEAVQFRGEADDDELVRCYQQCDLFVLPNRDIDGDIEGFGMVLLEAQSCGRPVLAGASGGTAETLSAGETGELAPCTDPSSVADRICALLADRPRLDAMGRAGRSWVTAHFGWESLARQAAALFTNLAATGRAERDGLRAGSTGSPPPAANRSVPGRRSA